MNVGMKDARIAIIVDGNTDPAQVEQLADSIAATGATAQIVSTADALERWSKRNATSLDASPASAFAGMVVPGRVENAGSSSGGGRSTDAKAVQFAREMMLADKPVAVVGSGLKLLAAADAIGGRTVVAVDALRSEIEGQGGSVVDAAVQVDGRLLTARTAADVPRLLDRLGAEFETGVAESRVDQLSEASFPASDPPPGPTAVGGQGASTSASTP